MSYMYTLLNSHISRESHLTQLCIRICPSEQGGGSGFGVQKKKRKKFKTFLSSTAKKIKDLICR